MTWWLIPLILTLVSMVLIGLSLTSKSPFANLLTWIAASFLANIMAVVWFAAHLWNIYA